MQLEKEQATYERERSRLIAEGHVGKIVLVFEDKILGVFATLEEAAEQGYEQVGLDRLFMVRPITVADQPVYASRSAVRARDC